MKKNNGKKTDSTAIYNKQVTTNWKKAAEEKKKGNLKKADSLNRVAKVAELKANKYASKK